MLLRKFLLFFIFATLLFYASVHPHTLAYVDIKELQFHSDLTQRIDHRFALSVNKTYSFDLPNATSYKYVMVTPEVFLDAVRPLAQWKLEKGVPAYVATTEWICRSYGGLDDAWRIREFLKDAYNTWRIMYVLLVGNTSLVPTRFVYMPYDRFGIGEGATGKFPNREPTDWYYADLDVPYDWYDPIHREYGLNAQDSSTHEDLYGKRFELAIGRLPADTFDETKVMVDKIINYERAPSYGEWTSTALLIGAKHGPDVYLAEFVQKLFEELFQDRDLTVYKLYVLPDGFSNISAVTLSSLINKGVSIIHISAHGNGYQIIDDPSRIHDPNAYFLNVSIASSLTNEDKLPFIEAIEVCATLESYYRTIGIGEEQTIPEIMLKSRRGGVISWIGHTSYSSWHMLSLFWRNFFNASTGQYKPGLALMYAKNEWWELYGKNRTEIGYPLLVSGLNLLGDPELSVLPFREEIQPLQNWGLYLLVVSTAMAVTVITIVFYRKLK